MSLLPASQIFTANGVEYLIANASVSLGLDQTLGFQCTADLDANRGKPAPAPGMPFVLSQQCNGVQEYRGIIQSVSWRRGSNFTQWDISGVGYSDAASHIRIFKVYGPGGASQILQDAWEEFGPAGVTLAIDPGAPEIDGYESTYNSLIDLTNYVTNSTGWSWTLEAGVFRFFNPLARDDGELGHMDFERGTLRADYDMSGLFNVARQLGYQYGSVGYYTPAGAGFSKLTRFAGNRHGPCYLSLLASGSDNMGGLPLREWEVVEIIPDGIMVPGSTPKDVSFSLNDSRTGVELSTPILRGGVRVIFRRPVWGGAKDDDSIAIYGRREAPNLSGGGSDEIQETLRRLRTYVSERAFPVVTLSGNVNRSDVAPGDHILFDLPELALSRMLVVDSVRRTSQGDDLQVSITSRAVMDRPGPAVMAAKPRPDIAPEIFRRLDRMENAALSPTSPAGMVWVDVDPIQEIASFEGSYEWEGSFIVSPLPGPDPEGLTLEEDEI